MNKFIEFTVEYLAAHNEFQYIYYADTHNMWSGKWNSRESREKYIESL